MAPGAGLGFKPQHFDDALAATDEGLWLEVHPENYLVDGGPRRALLRALRERHPLSLHGVSLSLAGAQPLDTTHLQRLAALVRELQPALVSEHLAWCAWGPHTAPDLLPVPRSTEALQHIAGHIHQAQDALGRRIAIENPSHYLHLPGHDWGEADFLNELVRRTGCGLLLDVNNAYVSAHNLGTHPHSLLDHVNADAVVEIHLAGHQADPRLGAALLIDSHDAPVADAVWALYERVIARIGARPTLIERDDHIPTWAELMQERQRAQQLLAAPEVPA